MVAVARNLHLSFAFWALVAISAMACKGPDGGESASTRTASDYIEIVVGSSADCFGTLSNTRVKNDHGTREIYASFESTGGSVEWTEGKTSLCLQPGQERFLSSCNFGAVVLSDAQFGCP